MPWQYIFPRAFCCTSSNLPALALLHQVFKLCETLRVPTDIYSPRSLSMPQCISSIPFFALNTTSCTWWMTTAVVGRVRPHYPYYHFMPPPQLCHLSIMTRWLKFLNEVYFLAGEKKIQTVIYISELKRCGNFCCLYYFLIFGGSFVCFSQFTSWKICATLPFQAKMLSYSESRLVPSCLSWTTAMSP